MFNLKDVSFKRLDDARRQMGAKLIKWENNTDSLQDMEFKPIAIEYKTFADFIQQVGRLENGILIDKRTGRVVFVYIKDHIERYNKNVLGDPGKGNRVHLAWCDVLEKMNNGGRFGRYVGTDDASGYFDIDYKYNTGRIDSGKVKLHVCMYCLGELGLKFSVDKANYDFAEHKEKYDQTLVKRPKRTPAQTPPNEYPQNWSEISRGYRQSKGWKCEECGVDLSHHPNLLDTHHISGNKWDSNPNNLKALCKVCHQNQYKHERSSVSEEDWKRIMELR